MESKMKDVIEVLDFGFSAVNVGKDLFKDGSFHFEAVGELLPLYPKAQAAFDNIGNSIPELTSIDEQGAAELIAFATSKGVANDQAMKIISETLVTAVHAIKLIKAIKG